MILQFAFALATFGLSGTGEPYGRVKLLATGRPQFTKTLWRFAQSATRSHVVR